MNEQHRRGGGGRCPTQRTTHQAAQTAHARPAGPLLGQSTWPHPTPRPRPDAVSSRPSALCAPLMHTPQRSRPSRVHPYPGLTCSRDCRAPLDLRGPAFWRPHAVMASSPPRRPQLGGLSDVRRPGAMAVPRPGDFLPYKVVWSSKLTDAGLPVAFLAQELVDLVVQIAHLVVAQRR